MDPHVPLIVAMLATFVAALLVGVPVAWSLGGTALLFTLVAMASDAWFGTFIGLDFDVFGLTVNRTYQLMENWVLVALPMFILMGHLLDRSGVAEDLMDSLGRLLGRIRGGLALSVTAIGVLLAASTGIIGASVVLLTVLGMPTMLRQGYRRDLAMGAICGAGTLGILIPPSIMLILMADQLRVPVGDLFMGALLPGLLLAGLYSLYIVCVASIRPHWAPSAGDGGQVTLGEWLRLLRAVLPALGLILLVLGSIFAGIATPTEASGLGVAGAAGLAALHRRMTMPVLRSALEETFKTTGFLFAIFIGATCFSLVLRMLGGDAWIAGMLATETVGPAALLGIILAVIFLLGFFLDWIEITLIVLPLIRPVVSAMELTGFPVDTIEQGQLVWFAVLCAVTLQTSFLTPPVGFALFYAKGAAPSEVTSGDVYRGAIPFILLQLVGLALVFAFPQLVLALPAMKYGG